MGGKIEKPHGAQRRAWGGAEASVRRFAPLSGLRSAPRAQRCAPVWFFNFTTPCENKVKILCKKVRDTQPNPRYQPKTTWLCIWYRRLCQNTKVHGLKYLFRAFSIVINRFIPYLSHLLNYCFSENTKERCRFMPKNKFHFDFLYNLHFTNIIYHWLHTLSDDNFYTHLKKG